MSEIGTAFHNLISEMKRTSNVPDMVKPTRRVMTFSRTFPSYHPRKGEQTRFIEKIYAGLADIMPEFKIPNDANDLWDWHEYYNCSAPKFHTIRAGHRWKAGDWFSPRVWGNDINPKSGKSGPYHSKQITFAPDIQVKKVFDFSVVLGSICIGEYMMDGEIESHHETLEQLAMNDGLSKDELLQWFRYPKDFTGQIICWNETIEY
jgi:hypothetical protein